MSTALALSGGNLAAATSASGSAIGNFSSNSSSSTEATQAANSFAFVEQNADASDTVPVYMQHMTVILVILHVSVFVTGLIGNSLVCLSVYRNKSLQTVTNYYIVNLAVADFLVILICLPPTVYWDLNLTWNFGLIPCKLVLYLQVSFEAARNSFIRPISGLARAHLIRFCFGQIIGANSVDKHIRAT